MSEDAPPSVIAAWEAVNSAWDQPATHDAFLATVSQAEAFAWAAKKYKERGDDPIATERLGKLSRAAVFVLTASAAKRPPEKSPYRMLVMLLIVAMLAIFVAILMLDTLPKRRHQPAQPVQMR
ncbi:MAG TPA: hypothetical protein VGM90_09535 [Kofleriaceae bacterium]